MRPAWSASRLIAVLCVLLFTVVLAPQAHASPLSSALAPRAATALTPAFDHIFVVVMENTSAASIIGNTSQAPYINSLASKYAYSTSYFGITHPSLPNYLTLTGASSFGITTDCLTNSCPVNAINIADRLEGAGKTWKAYMESMPSACSTTDTSLYAQKHNPFVYYNDIRTNATRCAAHDVPFTQLATDLKAASTTPNFGWITPNMCNDMHDCTIATGDAWLKTQIPAILNSPAFTLQNSALFLTWDEDDFSGNNRVDFVMAGSHVKAAYASSITYNHYSLLRTIEDAWGLAPLTTNDTAATAMTDLFTSTVPPPPPTSCTATNLAGNPAAAPADSTVALSATATTCTSPQYEFWAQGPTGAWAIKQGWGGSAFSWSNAGLAPGAHQLQVWARQAGSTKPKDAYGITTSTVTFDNCVGASLTSSLVPPQVRGAKVLFTASSAGCSSPQYGFLLMAPGGTFKVVQAYGAGNTWQLDTSLYPSGNFQVALWARQAGSASSHDAVFTTTYYVSPPAGCVVSALNAGLASPQAVGAAVTFTPQQTGCTKQYRFWLLPPGGAWRIVQAYGVGSTWTWKTAGATPGSYQVEVWEGTATTRQSYAITSFTLGVVTCTSANRSSNLAAPQRTGASISFTASATRCASPQYEFWILPPGGAWTLKQGYGASPWSWVTAGLAPGTYQISVWARQAGSTAAHDAYFVSTYDLSA